MGVSHSRLTPDTVADLQRATHFDRKEIQSWHRSFCRECPTGALSRPAFHQLYRDFFPFGDPTRFADLVFRLFDADGSGDLSFGEYLVALSVASRGRVEEKIKCTLMWR